MSDGNNPKNQFWLNPESIGEYQDDPADLKNAIYIGTDGNVVLSDTVHEAALFTPTIAVDSDLEQLVAELADDAGITEVELATALFTVGMLTLAGSPNAVVPSSPAWFWPPDPSGDIEIDNGILTVGDILNAGDGNDVVLAGGGNDIVLGGDGNDQLRGDDGIDALFGEAGNDVLDGGAENDYLAGGDGNDVLRGDDGNDFLLGGNGDDVLLGGDGRDRMEGGNGADLLIAGDGGNNEILFLGKDPSGSDFFDRDNFEDIVRAAASFDENGTDSIFEYSDGQGGTIAPDVIDLSDAFDFSVDADTTEERQTELLDAFHVVGVGAPGFPRAELRDADESIWFNIYEDGAANTQGAAPEVVTVEVDGFRFEWEVFGEATWVEI